MNSGSQRDSSSTTPLLATARTDVLLAAQAGAGPLQPVSGAPAPARSIDWRNTIFLVAVHSTAAAGLIAYMLLHHVTLSACIIGVVGTGLTIFGISAGYHRLFSHRAYEAGVVLRAVLLVLGAASFQTSALTWASTHRRHHRHVDQTPDPYNATRGFWYSHVGWVLERLAEPKERAPVPDLERDPLVRWQHRHTLLIGACAGLALPALIGWSLGDVWGGLLFGGLLRLVATYHLTFSINSFVHKFGTQPYSERNTSRDNVLAAFLTFGEGYHNYHHTFPVDYRNGARWHEFDPTKWVLSFCEWWGLAWNLKRTPVEAVARARLRTDQARVRRARVPNALKARVRAASRRSNEALARWWALSRSKRALCSSSVRKRGKVTPSEIDARWRAARRNFEREYAQWRRLTYRLKPRRATPRRAAVRPAPSAALDL